MKSNWDVVFTRAYRKDVNHLPKDCMAKYDRCIESLIEDPYQKTKKIKNDKHGFRCRFGDYRIRYRMPPSTNRIILRSVQHRSKIYKQEDNKDIIVGPIGILTQEGIETHRGMEATGTDIKTTEVIAIIKEENEQVGQPNMPLGDNVEKNTEIPTKKQVEKTESYEVESILIDIDELYLLRIPEEFHEIIQAADDLEDLKTCGLPESSFSVIQAYLDNPDQSILGTLYSLDTNGADSFRDLPLKDFLLAPDLLQKRIIDKPLNAGPLMVRGGPGTGKTLIGLHRLRRVIQERGSESLFDEHEPSFIFMSYTNALVNSGQELFKSIANFSEVDIQFSTFDKVVFKLLGNYYRKKNFRIGDATSDGTTKFRLKTLTLKEMLNGNIRLDVASAKYVDENFDLDFLAEEIQSVIEGNDIKSKADYLDFKRVGRKTAIKKQAREHIWKVYERFRDLCAGDNKYTWSGRQLKLLNLIENGVIQGGVFDSLILDEAQDMSPVALRLAAKLIKDPRYLLLLADSGQSIYNKSPTWKSIHKDYRFHRGNSVNMSKSYRMTKELSRALQPLRNDADVDSEDPIQRTRGAFNGDKPVWLNDGLDNHNSAIIDIINYIVNKKKINAGQIAIVLRSMGKLGNGKKYTLRNDLIEHGFQVDVFDKSKPIDIHGNCIHIINAHSAKGLEFPFVIVPYLSDSYFPFDKSRPNTKDEFSIMEWLECEQRLLYVALSRASYRLWIISDENNPSRFLSTLNKAHWDKTYA